MDRSIYRGGGSLLICSILALVLFGRLSEFNGYYYAVLTVVLVALAFERLRRPRFFLRAGPGLGAWLGLLGLAGVVLINLLLFVPDDHSTFDIKGWATVSCFFAPMLLFLAGYHFGSASVARVAAFFLVAQLAWVVWFVGAGAPGAQVAQIAIGGGLFAFACARPRSRASFAIGVVLFLLAVFRTEYGSRTLFVFSVGLIALFLFTRYRRQQVVRLFLIFALAVGGASLALTSGSAPFIDKLLAGLSELLPSEFDISGFGGASNLRGYETFMLIERTRGSTWLEILIGSGPNAGLGIDARINDVWNPQELQNLHNALGTCFLKFGVLGVSAFIFSLWLILSRLTVISKQFAFLWAVGVGLSVLIGSGPFVATWAEMYFLFGVSANLLVSQQCRPPAQATGDDRMMR